MSLRLFVAALLPALASGAGCGGAHTEVDLHAVFQRIQVDEARIEHAEAGLGPEAPCEERALACREICEAAHDACEAARSTADRDAAARCERAEHRCDGCRSGQATLCPESAE